MAEFERELTRERTHAGLQAPRDRGRVGGRPTAMTDERRQVAQRMLDDGYRPAQIAETLGVSRSTIYRPQVTLGGIRQRPRRLLGTHCPRRRGSRGDSAPFVSGPMAFLRL
jgi:DNA invertase Pin-like site-specific DNA recombinase